MTIELTKTVYIAGVLRSAGYQMTMSAGEEAYFVNSGLANYIGSGNSNFSPGAQDVNLITTLAGEDQARDVMKTLQEWNYSVVNATGVTVLKNGIGSYGGYRILAAAGAFTMDIYDNVAASGQKIEVAAVSVNAAADKFINPGLRFLTGLAVNLSGDPTDGLILVLWK